MFEQLKVPLCFVAEFKSSERIDSLENLVPELVIVVGVVGETAIDDIDCELRKDMVAVYLLFGIQYDK